MTNGKSYGRFVNPELIAGVAVFLIMTAILGKISQTVINHEPSMVTDVQLSTWLYNHRSPFLTKVMFVVTSLGSTGVVTCIAVALGFYLLWRRRWYWLAVVGASVGGGALLNRLLKYAFQRPRPQFDDPILALTSYSFPSGHTMAATVLFGVLAAYLCAKTREWRWRVLIVLLASLLIGLVGFSRIYLGAHYLSDVLGAMAEGFAWLSLCLTVLQSIRRKHHAA